MITPHRRQRTHTPPNRAGPIYSSGADQLDITAGGVLQLSVSTSAAIFAGAVRVIDGTAGGPAIHFGSDTNTGIYSVAADKLGITVGGVLRLNVTDTVIVKTEPMTGEDGSASNPAYSFTNDTDSGMYSVGANSVGIGAGNGLRLTVSDTVITSAEPIEVVAGNSSNPGYGFDGDADTGMFRSGANVLAFTAGGTKSIQIAATGIHSGIAGTYSCGLTSSRWLKGWFIDIDSTNAVNVSSDMRLKTRTDDSLGLDFVCDLEPFAGHWTAEGDAGGTHQWLSAQNVHQALSAAGVDPHDSTVWSEDDNGSQSLAMTELIPVLVRSVQELRDEIRAS